MGETFYSLLGVGTDADAETIRRAYRERVKECHPDVSEDPAAPGQFRRLTTARDVLLDDAERDRYDRLGHDAYVDGHVDASVWTASVGTSGESPPSDGRSRDRRADTGRTGPGRRRGPSGGSATDRTAWLGEDGSQDRDGETARRRDRRGGTRTATGGFRDGRGWQHAPGAYERVGTDVDEPAYAARLLRGIRAVGPWLAVHFVFLLSALATGWFTFTEASGTLEPSLPAVVFGVLVVALVVFVSVVHVVSQLYG